MTGAGHFLSITLISSGKEEFFKNLHTALLFICFFFVLQSKCSSYRGAITFYMIHVPAWYTVSRTCRPI